MPIQPMTEVSHLGPRQVCPFRSSAEDTQEVLSQLHRFGIGFDNRDLQAMFNAYQGGETRMLSGGAMGMDAILQPVQNLLTTPSISTPIQFLQAWLPGFVFFVTQARKIDDLVGITTQGRWEDEEIV